jgi:hypothetical protein
VPAIPFSLNAEPRADAEWPGCMSSHSWFGCPVPDGFLPASAVLFSANDNPTPTNIVISLVFISKESDESGSQNKSAQLGLVAQRGATFGTRRIPPEKSDVQFILVVG